MEGRPSAPTTWRFWILLGIAHPGPARPVLCGSSDLRRDRLARTMVDEHRIVAIGLDPHRRFRASTARLRRDQLFFLRKHGAGERSAQVHVPLANHPERAHGLPRYELVLWRSAPADL